MYKTIKYNEIIWNMRTHEKQYQKKKIVKKEIFIEISLNDIIKTMLAVLICIAPSALFSLHVRTTYISVTITILKGAIPFFSCLP